VSEPSKILFFYLNTGGGHKAPAKALADWINKRRPEEARAVVANGVSDKNPVLALVLEQGYRIITTQFPRAWKAFYETSQPRFALFFNSMAMSLVSTCNLIRTIRREKPDLVVNCHFLLGVPLKVVRRLFGLRFKLITLCTDPFSIHPFWFYRQNGTVMVFSKIARDEAMALHKVPAARVPVFPWVMQEKFSERLSAEQCEEFKASLGLEPGRPLVLVSGGGEGLPKTEKYFEALLSSAVEFDIVVVCGRNRIIKRHCDELLERYENEAAKPFRHQVLVFGFTPRMYELINAAYLVISKAGTSSIMETLLMGKPLIIAQYIFGQELGNAGYVVRKGMGGYAPVPDGLKASVERLVADNDAYQQFVGRIADANIENGTPKVARFLLDIAKGS
jgi:UDP-N-acetylglucosamine:LPS N-acetylglucosamine transferase